MAKPPSQRTADRRVGLPSPQKQILAEAMPVRILDPDLACAYIRQRQQQGIDRDDEVWDGVYIVPPLANNPHQQLVGALTSILRDVIVLPGRGQVFPGANVSDRRAGWERQFRAPAVVVVLNGGRAVDCTTHWMGGPDFLIEIQSPRDETDQKRAFYGSLQVRELLVIHRDTRRLHLYRHDGRQLAAVAAVDFEGGKWLVSQVVPLAFRRKVVRGAPATEARRTDGQPGRWQV